MDENLVTKFVNQINQIVDYKLSGLTKIESAIVESVNVDGTVNLFIPPNSTIYHNILNQSVCQNLQPGDCVKIIKENNDLSNMWIIGGFQKNINTVLEEKNNQIQMQMTLQKQEDFLNSIRMASFSVLESPPRDLNNLELNTQVGIPSQVVYYIPNNPEQSYSNYPVKRGGLLECMGASDIHNTHKLYYFEKYFCIPEPATSTYTSNYFRIGTQDLDAEDTSIKWTSWLYM